MNGLFAAVNAGSLFDFLHIFAGNMGDILDFCAKVYYNGTHRRMQPPAGESVVCRTVQRQAKRAAGKE